jgi:hypothetical protein
MQDSTQRAGADYLDSHNRRQINRAADLKIGLAARYDLRACTARYDDHRRKAQQAPTRMQQ